MPNTELLHIKILSHLSLAPCTCSTTNGLGAGESGFLLCVHTFQ